MVREQCEEEFGPKKWVASQMCKSLHNANGVLISSRKMAQNDEENDSSIVSQKQALPNATP